MKWYRYIAAAFLMGAAATANAQFSGGIALVSDYDFRGISQSAGDFALQGNLDFSTEMGFYIGTWASQIDFGDCCGEDFEVDFYGGYAGEFWDGFSYDVGYNQYTYPGTDGLDYGEFYAGIGFGGLELKAWYTNNFFNIDESALYLEVNAEVELPKGFVLLGHLGHTGGDALGREFQDQTGLTAYTDWSVGVGYQKEHVYFEAKVVDSIITERFEVTSGVGENDTRLIGTIGFSF